MIDHTGVNVSNFEQSKQFYLAALSRLGYELIQEFDATITGSNLAGFGVGGKPDFWIGEGEIQTPRIHVAFVAESRALVDAFYEAALKVGGRDNGMPGLRSHYHPNYYGAFVLDPDGHNIEAVCHTPE